MKSFENFPITTKAAAAVIVGGLMLTGCKGGTEQGNQAPTQAQSSAAHNQTVDEIRTTLADRYDDGSCILKVETTPHHPQAPVPVSLTLSMKPEARPVFDDHKEDNTVEWRNGGGITTRIIHGGDRTTYDQHFGMDMDMLQGNKDSTTPDAKEVYNGNLVKGVVKPAQSTYEDHTQVFFYKDASVYANGMTTFRNVFCGAMQYDIVNGTPTWHQVEIAEPQMLEECTRSGDLLRRSYDSAPGTPCAL